MKKTFLHKNRAGQVILIALILLGSLGLIGVSVATQMVLEQRKAVLEEKTQKAYYAAESGIEEALKRIKTDGSVSNFNITGVGGADAAIQAGEAASGNELDIGVQLNSGEPFYFNLTGYTGNTLTLCWDKNNTSFLVSVYYRQNGTNDRKAYYYGINTTNGQTPKIQAGVNAAAGAGCGFNTYQYTLTMKPAPIAAADVYDYLVVWPLYQNQVRIAFLGTVSLPTQGTVITSTGTVEELDGSITRRLKFFQSARNYPSSFMLNPLYLKGGITFGPGKNW